MIKILERIFTDRERAREADLVLYEVFDQHNDQLSKGIFSVNSMYEAYRSQEKIAKPDAMDHVSDLNHKPIMDQYGRIRVHHLLNKWHLAL